MRSVRPRPKRDPMTLCFVPKCKNRALTSPDKHFFRVPDRNKASWCIAVGRANVTKGTLYVCEDHVTYDVVNKLWSNKFTNSNSTKLLNTINKTIFKYKFSFIYLAICKNFLKINCSHPRRLQPTRCMAAYALCVPVIPGTSRCK